MLEILIGLISGTISGLGMGGGTFLILLLSLFAGLDQHTAQAANLVFFVPTSIIAIIIHARNKALNIKNAAPVALFGIVGAIGGAIISRNMQVGLLRKLFGIFLLVIVGHEIYSFYKEYRKNKKKT